MAFVCAGTFGRMSPITLTEGRRLRATGHEQSRPPALVVRGSWLVATMLTLTVSAQPYVDYWDSLQTVKRSEGIYVNGLEWGEWSYWDRDGKLTEISNQAAGILDNFKR